MTTRASWVSARFIRTIFAFDACVPKWSNMENATRKMVPVSFSFFFIPFDAVRCRIETWPRHSSTCRHWPSRGYGKSCKFRLRIARLKQRSPKGTAKKNMAKGNLFWCRFRRSRHHRRLRLRYCRRRFLKGKMNENTLHVRAARFVSLGPKWNSRARVYLRQDERTNRPTTIGKAPKHTHTQAETRWNGAERSIRKTHTRWK